jgi:hypothetical protein
MRRNLIPSVESSRAQTEGSPPLPESYRQLRGHCGLTDSGRECLNPAQEPDHDNGHIDQASLMEFARVLARQAAAEWLRQVKDGEGGT